VKLEAMCTVNFLQSAMTAFSARLCRLHLPGFHVFPRDPDNVIQISSHVKRDLGTHHAQMSSRARKMAAAAARCRHYRFETLSALVDFSM
jgi:hypothetical protein